MRKINNSRSLFLIITLLFLTIPGYSNSAILNTISTNDSIRFAFEQKIDKCANDSLKKIEAYSEFANYLINEGEYEASIEPLKNALRISLNTNQHKKVSDVANLLANMYAATGDFAASNKSYKIALESAEKTNDSGEIAKISMNLASNYNYLGEYKKATEYGLYALKTKETTHNLERICYHYIAMGNIFRENNNIEKWAEYVQKAYKMKAVKGCASFGDSAKIYNSLGGIAVQRNELEKGMLYYDTLLTICKNANYTQGISAALTNNAGIYKQLENFDKALELANEAEKYFGNNSYDILFSNNFKAEIYQHTGKYKKALDLANTNIQLEEISNYSTEKLKCLQLLYELNYNLNNVDAAFYWNDSLRSLENYLRDVDMRQSFEELEAKYESEKKEQQIELLTSENKLKNQALRAGIALSIILVIVIFLIIYILHIRKKQALLIQNDLKQQVLRSQMNPHFIFNVLGSIQNFMIHNDTRKASGFLAQFASLTRATLDFSSSETISLANEINMLQNYIELEKMRSKNKFDFNICFHEDLEIDFIQIPPMLIQPFVENSIKHGFKNLNYKGQLEIRITDKVDWIEFTIEDNGGGIKKSALVRKQHNSMAMKIFEKRRKLIEQKYKKEFKFDSYNLKDRNPKRSGVHTTINIPVLNND